MSEARNFKSNLKKHTSTCCVFKINSCFILWSGVVFGIRPFSKNYEIPAGDDAEDMR
jgi:hypothetical protein